MWVNLGWWTHGPLGCHAFISLPQCSCCYTCSSTTTTMNVEWINVDFNVKRFVCLEKCNINWIHDYYHYYHHQIKPIVPRCKTVSRGRAESSQQKVKSGPSAPVRPSIRFAKAEESTKLFPLNRIIVILIHSLFFSQHVISSWLRCFHCFVLQ